VHVVQSRFYVYGHGYGITFIRYTQGQTFGQKNNLKVFEARKPKIR